MLQAFSKFVNDNYMVDFCNYLHVCLTFFRTRILPQNIFMWMEGFHKCHDVKKTFCTTQRESSKSRNCHYHWPPKAPRGAFPYSRFLTSVTEHQARSSNHRTIPTKQTARRIGETAIQLAYEYKIQDPLGNYPTPTLAPKYIGYLLAISGRLSIAKATEVVCSLDNWLDRTHVTPTPSTNTAPRQRRRRAGAGAGGRPVPVPIAASPRSA